MPFEFKKSQEIYGITIIMPRSFGDERGWFAETYKRSEFDSAGIEQPFVQENHSMSTQRGVIRGLHYQLDPAAQGKLVRCLRGRVFDVAVDLRQGSPSYGKWFGETLSGENKMMLWVPPGFAHGFQTLSEGTEVLYKVTHEYSPEHERSLRWDDPKIAIRWPVQDAVLNERDRRAPTIETAENNFRYRESDP